MNYTTSPQQKKQTKEYSRSQQQAATELRQKAEKLRDEAEHAAEFWLAEQYEISARLMS